MLRYMNAIERDEGEFVLYTHARLTTRTSVTAGEDDLLYDTHDRFHSLPSDLLQRECQSPKNTGETEDEDIL